MRGELPTIGREVVPSYPERDIDQPDECRYLDEWPDYVGECLD